MSLAGNGKLLVITGPSGVGKSTLTERIVANSDAEYSVSMTTRRPRPGEVDGREYHFTDVESFERMKQAGELLEWAEIFGSYYGTPVAPVKEAVQAGRVILMDIDFQGGRQVHDKAPDGIFILIVPPDMEELRRRLCSRGTEDDNSLETRLGQAEDEIRSARESGIYDYEIVNDDLDRAVKQVLEIVQNQD
jgi:guanylate kinase